MRSKEEGENVVEMVMMVLKVITPFIAQQCVSCNTISAMKGKGKDMERESGERGH